MEVEMLHSFSCWMTPRQEFWHWVVSMIQIKFDSFLDSLLTGLITLKSFVQANLWWIWYVFLHAFGVKMMN